MCHGVLMDQGDNETLKEKVSRHRSPPYPSRSLPEALQYARQLYEAQKKNLVHLDAAIQSLGYNPKSSGGARAIAASMAFGLLDDEGTGSTRKVKVSDFGFKLIMLGEADPDRLALLREAARKPSIYSDMLSEWPDGLPSDEAIKKYLILERNFNPASVPPLIADFRATLAAAKLNDESGSSSQQDETGEKGKTSSASGTISFKANVSGVSSTQEDTSMTSLVVPIREGVEASLRFPVNLTVDEFQDMKEYIETFLTVQERKVTRMAAQPSVRLGPATWRNKDGDHPVMVTGSLGKRNGRDYVSVEGSDSGVPLDEIVSTV